MSKYFLSCLIWVLLGFLSCNQPSAPIVGPSGGPGAPITPANPPINKDGFSSCSAVLDMAVCSKAVDTSGKPLGCVEHTFTKKCVDPKWQGKLKKGECALIEINDCLSGKTQLFEEVSSELKVVGLCGFNRKSAKCEEVTEISAEAKPKQRCVPNSDKAVGKEAADELCLHYQNSGGNDSSRITLKAMSKCNSVQLGNGSLFESISNICQAEERSEKCLGFLSLKDGDAVRRIEENNPLGKFCNGLVKRRNVSNPEFTQVREEEDYSDCGQKALFTPALSHNGQVEVSGTRKDVCALVAE